MRKSFRGGRLSGEIQRIISGLLIRELKDPRFNSLITVTGVKATNDGSFAVVYVVVPGADPTKGATEKEKHDVIDAFNSAKGIIRGEIGSQLGLRHAPDLQFKIDTSEEYGRHIEGIMRDLHLSDSAAEDRVYDTISDIADAITDAKTILLFPHENMDGDTLGSAVALCLALRSDSRDCRVVIDEKIPGNIAFIEHGCTVAPENVADMADESGHAADLCVLIDLADTDRIGKRADIFNAGANTMCIDHHVSGNPNYDFNHVDTSASATAEIIYDILEDIDAEIGKECAEAIYVGIVTDTGRFQYSNTTPKTHRIAGELIDLGAEPNKVSMEVYQNVRVEKIKLEAAVLGAMDIIADGKAIVACLTKTMMETTGAIEEETEGIAELLRSIRGVEVSVFLRESDNGKTKASMRSKTWFDVAAFAGSFGGGGHTRAAGFSVEQSIDEVRSAVKTKLEEELDPAPER